MVHLHGAAIGAEVGHVIIALWHLTVGRLPLSPATAAKRF